MTNAELITALRYCVNDDIRDCDDCPFNGKYRCRDLQAQASADALEAAGQRIAELQKQVNEFIKNETRSTVIKAMSRRISELEAQIPKEGECEAKKPKTVKETEWSFYCDCPTCGGRLISNADGEWCAGSFDRFCRMCGQKIDWSEYCGWSNKPFGAKMK